MIGRSDLIAKSLERVGHRAGDQVGVPGRAADDQAERDDAGRRIAIENGGDHHRDFKGTGHADQIDAALRHQLAEFLDGVFHHRIGELLVVFRGDDADPDFGSDNPGFWMQR